MQCSVSQMFMAKAEPPPAVEKGKSMEAPGQRKDKPSFQHKLRAVGRSHQRNPQEAGKKAALEDQTESAGLEAGQAQAVVREVMCTQLAAVMEAALEKLPDDIKATAQQLVQPLLEAAPETLRALPPVQAEAGQTTQIVPPAEANPGGPAAQAAEQLAGPELVTTAPGEEQQDGENSDESSAHADRFKLIFRENRNHVLLKLKLGPEDAQANPAADHAPGQAKKLMEFENHRLEASQLPTGPKPGSESVTTESEPQADADLVISGRENPGGIRIMARSSVTPASSAQQPVQTEELFEQIVERAKLMVKVNGAEMKIDLKPDSLGKLSIKVMFEDGLVTARFVTDNHQVKQMLESNLNTLRHNLENQGIKVDRTEVEVQVGNQPDFGAGNWNRENWSGQPGLKQRSVAPEDNDQPVELETAMLSSPAGDAWSNYPADGGMNLLV